ncbi:MAG TPA: hypothetical protein PK047_05405 [Saprospiraceae bacterium]|jgi:hypothetical protein|nr:hypothetical protein [Saprospiraceae bacterium]HRO08283.1 hypothetical protein [Saprospiraceae bacterium]HRP41174.1 hypothetical protein [Saprospiraceae bacterium]
MKQLLFCMFFCLSLMHSASAQLEIGIKAGVSSYDLANKGLLVKDGNENFQWTILDAGYGHHFGVYTRLTLLGLYVEPAMLFNSSTVNYNLKTYGERGVFNVLRQDTYHGLDMPVLAGFKIGAMRFQGGVVGHLFVGNAGELLDIKGYSQKFKTGTFGWQAGTGIDVWRLRLDLVFEGNFSNFGNHIRINGYNYAFSETPSRLMLTAGFRLF